MHVLLLLAGETVYCYRKERERIYLLRYLLYASHVLSHRDLDFLPFLARFNVAKMMRY